MFPFDFKNLQDHRRIVTNIWEVGMSCGGQVMSGGTDEHAMLYEIAAFHCPSNGIFCEMGTAYGISAAVIAKGIEVSLRSQPLLAIDLYVDRDSENNYSPTLYIARKLFRKCGVDHLIVPVAFHDIFFYNHFLIDTPIAFIFLDSGHTYEHVKSQLQTVFPNVVKGGWCCIHDYCEECKDEVIPAVNEFVDGHKSEINKIFHCNRTVAINKV